MSVLPTLIGAGCASLSLARYASQHNLSPFEVYSDRPFEDRDDHSWGFWGMPWCDQAASCADHSWQKWQIISENETILHHSHAHPYYMISARKWLSDCAGRSGISQVISPIEKTPHPPYLDSRPLQAPKGSLLQHFIGHHITTKSPCFAPDCAILMDFRCDQSQGLHFIYLLPTSPTKALIESTLFTDTLLDDAFYETAISDYLNRFYQITDYDIRAKERGVIPLADCRDRALPSHAIGARGGALRPSSGYAFSFIQKQALQIVDDYQKQGRWHAKSPLSARDLWMDRVFLSVLSQRPDLSISLFLALGKALNGSEFARFMSGEASLLTLAKIILAMPKGPFIKAAWLSFGSQEASS